MKEIGSFVTFFLSLRESLTLRFNDFRLLISDGAQVVQDTTPRWRLNRRQKLLQSGVSLNEGK